MTDDQVPPPQQPPPQQQPQEQAPASPPESSPLHTRKPTNFLPSGAPDFGQQEVIRGGDMPGDLQRLIEKAER